MRGVGRVPCTVLQHACAVDHRIHAGEMWEPLLRLPRMAQIERDPAQTRRRPARNPRQRNHFVALGQ
jgi:hypothetical protein